MNTRKMPRSLATLTAVAAVLAGTTLAACNRADDTRTAGERIDSATATAERKTEQAAGDMKATVNDATITAAVNAKLAADKELSALRINVDTSGGRVALHGTAPNQAARDRATQIASTVDGVRSVDNQLQIRSS